MIKDEAGSAERTGRPVASRVDFDRILPALVGKTLVDGNLDVALFEALLACEVDAQDSGRESGDRQALHGSEHEQDAGVLGQDHCRDHLAEPAAHGNLVDQQSLERISPVLQT